MKTASDLVAAAKARVKEVPVADADEAIRNAQVVVDVREADEFAAGHVPGAVHISRGMLEFRFSGMPALQSRDIAIVLYCKTSGRAALAGVALQEMGYLNVTNISGGFDAWAAAGKPVAKPDVPKFD